MSAIVPPRQPAPQPPGAVPARSDAGRRAGTRLGLPGLALPGLGLYVLLATAMALPAMAPAAQPAARFTLPALVQPASDEHHPGKIIWLDLVTPDLATARRFYGTLLGWTFQDIHDGKNPYAIALVDGMPVAGLYQPAKRARRSRQPMWLTYLSVPDLTMAEQTVMAHGGKLLSSPRTYPQRGEQAVFTDPQGAVFALLQSSSGDPPDALSAPGQWVWSSVMTRDANTDAAFYQNVLGYSVYDMQDDSNSNQHVVLASGGYARASCNVLPANAVKPHPHWLNYVRVVDVADTAARVKLLGGRVLVAPRADESGNQIAVVTDPSGAPFGLYQWRENSPGNAAPGTTVPGGTVPGGNASGSGADGSSGAAP